MKREEGPGAELARFRDIVHHMEPALIVYHLEDPADDRTLRIMSCNPSVERILGVPTAALVGRTIDEVFPELRPNGIPAIYADVVRTGVPWSSDYLHTEERVLVIAFSLRAFPLPGGCLGAMFVDATERVRVQEDLRRSEARQRALVDALPDTLFRLAPDGLVDVRHGTPGCPRLSRRVAQEAALPFEPGEVRVFECQEGGIDLEVRVLKSGGDETLAIVRDITERKRGDRRKDEFISIVSHELRTPLTSIHGALGLIAGGVLGEAPKAMAELVTVARSNTDRLIRLINDMLDLDKMEAGRLDLELVPIDAGALVDAALEGMRGAAASAGVRLRRVTEQPGTVLGDRDRLLQVLTNLLSNALRFSPPQASVVVTVRAQGGRVRFLVRDEGPGVPPDRAHHLFRKFAQVSGVDGRRRGGTGLGLAISKAIVDQHDGAIGILPTESGATFFFEVPEVGGPPSTEDLLAELRVAYTAALPGQVAELAALVMRLPEDPASIPRVVAAAHRLHGTAGTYGLHAVSAAAADIERLARSGASAELDAAVAALASASASFVTRPRGGGPP